MTGKTPAAPSFPLLVPLDKFCIYEDPTLRRTEIQ